MPYPKNIIILLLVCIYFSNAYAITVSPISAKLDISKKRSHVINVINQNPNQSVPVNIMAMTWEIDKNGKEMLKPSKALMIYPRQIILKPNQRRSIRVAPRNKQQPIVEQAYRVIVEELPVKIGPQRKNKTGVNVLLAYATAFYIVPQNPQSILQLSSATRSPNGILITFHNKGNAHTHLRKLSLQIQQGEKNIVIDDEKKLNGLAGENILAGNTRIFNWKFPPLLASKINTKQPFSLSIQFECEDCSQGSLIFNTTIQ